jgi:tripartite-type tricarboxylate transporter receptor subunit TctC
LEVKAGTVRPLAISRIRRSSLYPDLPTLDEAGVKGFNLDAWAGLVAPAGTPAAVVKKLNTSLREIIDSPDVQARFKNRGSRDFPARLRSWQLPSRFSSACGKRW